MIHPPLRHARYRHVGIYGSISARRLFRHSARISYIYIYSMGLLLWDILSYRYRCLRVNDKTADQRNRKTVRAQTVNTPLHLIDCMHFTVDGVVNYVEHVDWEIFAGIYRKRGCSTLTVCITWSTVYGRRWRWRRVIELIESSAISRAHCLQVFYHRDEKIRKDAVARSRFSSFYSPFRRSLSLSLSGRCAADVTPGDTIGCDIGWYHATMAPLRWMHCENSLRQIAFLEVGIACSLAYSFAPLPIIRGYRSAGALSPLASTSQRFFFYALREPRPALLRYLTIEASSDRRCGILSAAR